MAGEANAPGSIFERLSAPEHFTGVYRRGYQSPGGGGYAINAKASPSSFRGHTNAASNEVIHDIRSALRPGVTKLPPGAQPFR